VVSPYRESYQETTEKTRYLYQQEKRQYDNLKASIQSANEMIQRAEKAILEVKRRIAQLEAKLNGRDDGRDDKKKSISKASDTA